MKKPASSPVRTSVDLWNMFQRQGGLLPETYDAELLQALVAELELDGDLQLERQLDTVSPTRFLVALLSALQPWSSMVSDVLQMFERHGVYTSNGEVLVEFDFQAGDLGKLRFDANHFKKAIEAFQRLLASLETISTSDNELFGLSPALENALAASHGIRQEDWGRAGSAVTLDGISYKTKGPPSSAAARRWFGYRPGATDPDYRFWPFDDALPFPTWRPSDPLAKALRPVVSVIVELSRRVSPYTSWDGLQDARRDEKSDPAVCTTQRAPIESWSLNRVLASQYDRMSRSLLQRLWLLHDLAPREAGARAALAAEVSRLVSERTSIVPRQPPGQVLEELLALPLWQFRHQLYSVWLVTAVEGAMPSHAVFRLKPVQGQLRFSFSATPIAAISVEPEEFELVAEVKTPAPEGIKLLGKSRVSSVQPDYLIRERDSKKVLYVLEAKQYRDGDKSNFSKALHDYAATHQEALVVVANYGPMPPDMREAVQELARKAETDLKTAVVDRCEAIGDVRPAEDGLQRLREHIALILPPAQLPPPTLVVDATHSMLQTLPEDREAVGVWPVLLRWPGPVVLVQDGSLMPLRAGEDLLSALRSRARSVQLNLGAAAIELPAGCVLITDGGGMEEARNHLDRFQAVVALQERGQKLELKLAPGASTFVVQSFAG